MVLLSARKRIFLKDIVGRCVGDFFFFYPPGKEFLRKIVFSCVCDFFFLDVCMFGCLFVDTITLERLNQSEPNFHT